MANAFNAIAPQSAASASPSKKVCYDVFINHRGKDVKDTLATDIYQMLINEGARAFLDKKELQPGDSFPHLLEEAIRSASVHIAIFSPRYAESPWCLEELCLMLQTNVPIIPVFYRVQPSDLRHVEKGKYGDALGQHNIKGRCNLEKIEEWKNALLSVSYITGSILDILDDEKCDEGKLREIVDSALQKLKREPLEVARFPVGLDEAVQDFERKFGSSTDSENVHIVGIVGMGGSGKTTVAKELYNKKCSSFSRCSFLSNVSVAASTNNLHELKRNLLKDLRIPHSHSHNIDQGKGLGSMSVLIVLDDVDSVDQMKTLLPDGMMHDLGQDSFIIITTRDMGVLKSVGISSIYHMKLLDSSKAKQLFCEHAFSGFEHSLDNDHKFEDLIEKFVKACKGLPLSLRVFGEMVNRQSPTYWESQLRTISQTLPREIAKSLKLSYDALKSQEQQMFLDVACFFIGRNKSMVVQIWDGSGWSGEVGWQTLVDKCLVGLEEDDHIEMHDHLRDLGREIAEDVSPSRIWKEEQISNHEGRTPIRGIVLDGDCRSTLGNCIEKIRPSLRELQLLNVRGNCFRNEFWESSRELVWLRLVGFNGTKLWPWLSLAHLRVVELDGAFKLKQLWRNNVQPPLQLRELIIRAGTCFRGLPTSIGRLKCLKKIVLSGKDNGMRSLPKEFCDLQSLEILELSCFSQLSSLPHHFGKLRNLRSVKLHKLGLTALPDSFKQLQSLHIKDCESLMAEEFKAGLRI